jgi:hypothetical protein
VQAKTLQFISLPQKKSTLSYIHQMLQRFQIATVRSQMNTPVLRIPTRLLVIKDQVLEITPVLFLTLILFDYSSNSTIEGGTEFQSL